MDISLSISPQLCLFGFDFYWKDEEYDYNEINIYFFILKLQFAWE